MNEPRRQYGVAGAEGVAIDQGLRQYMLGVYNYMALGVAATGVVAMLMASNTALIASIAGTPLKWVLFAGVLGIGFFAPKVIFSGSKAMAHAMFWIYAALWGALISTFIAAYVALGMSQEIYRAFFITASVFGAMSLWGYTTKKDLSGWGNFLMMAAVGLLIAIVVNIFLASTMMSFITSALVVVVFSAVTAYETQMIKSMYQEGGSMNERAAIFGAFALYGSFVTLFIHILNLLGIMRSE